MILFPAKDSVQLSTEGVIGIVVVGDQTAESIDQMHLELSRIVGDLRQQQKPVLGLVDVSKLGASTDSSHAAAIKLLQDMDYDKVAFVGAQGLVVKIMVSLLTASGKGDRIKLFNTQEEARDWLVS